MAARGLHRVRLLHQLRRALPLTDVDRRGAAPLAVRRLPTPGVDDDGWLKVNNRAFSWHPDQGGWDAERLRARLAEPWVRLDGFLVHDGRDGSARRVLLDEAPSGGRRGRRSRARRDLRDRRRPRHPRNRAWDGPWSSPGLDWLAAAGPDGRDALHRGRQRTGHAPLLEALASPCTTATRATRRRNLSDVWIRCRPVAIRPRSGHVRQGAGRRARLPRRAGLGRPVPPGPRARRADQRAEGARVIDSSPSFRRRSPRSPEPPPTTARRSSGCGTLPDGHRIETVLMHYPDRSTVCVSSQAGCAMACGFCATGQAGFRSPPDRRRDRRAGRPRPPGGRGPSGVEHRVHGDG